VQAAESVAGHRLFDEFDPRCTSAAMPGAWAVCLAAAKRNVAIVRALGDAMGHPAGRADGHGCTLFMCLCACDDAPGLATALAASSASDLQARCCGSGVTAMHIACRLGHAASVAALLAGGASLTTPDAHGCLPTSGACAHGHTDAVRALLDSGGAGDIDADVSGGGGGLMMRGSALSVACYHGHVDTVRVLLEAGADAAPSGGKAPVAVAAGHSHDEVRALLGSDAVRAAVDARDPATGTTALLRAAAAGQVEAVPALLAAEARRARRQLLLWRAALWGGVP